MAAKPRLLSGKQEAEKMFKLAQQKSAEMLVIEKNLEQKIIILNQLIKDREKVLGDINMEKDYIMVLSAPNPVILDWSKALTALVTVATVASLLEEEL